MGIGFGNANFKDSQRISKSMAATIFHVSVVIYNLIIFGFLVDGINNKTVTESETKPCFGILKIRKCGKIKIRDKFCILEAGD